jgi:hypothetical protein
MASTRTIQTLLFKLPLSETQSDGFEWERFAKFDISRLLGSGREASQKDDKLQEDRVLKLAAKTPFCNRLQNGTVQGVMTFPSILLQHSEQRISKYHTHVHIDIEIDIGFDCKSEAISMVDRSTISNAPMGARSKRYRRWSLSLRRKPMWCFNEPYRCYERNQPTPKLNAM